MAKNMSAFGGKNKNWVLLAALVFLAAGCNVFSQQLPAGVAKTVNGGTDWQFTNAIKGSTTVNLSSLSISKLAFDPQNRQNIFAGSFSGGLYESQDAAATWTNVLSNIYVYDFVISPQDSKTIYAAGFFDNHGRLLKTTDGGGSWNQVYNQEDATDAVRAVALSPTNLAELVIGTTDGEVIKSADGGQTWQLLHSFNDQVNRIFWINSNIYVLLKTQGLVQMTDSSGGAVNTLTDSLSKTFAFNYITGSNGIQDFSQAYVDPDSPTLIYLTTDRGLYKTTDGGKTWTLQNLPVKIDQLGAHAIDVAPSSSNIVVASVGSTVYRSTDGGQTWETQGLTTAGFINYLLIDPALPQIVYAGVYSTQ